MTTHLIIGLGNPGLKYKNTRHNVGFMAIEALAKELDAPGFKIKKRTNARVSEIRMDGKKIILAKPQLYMNLSGNPAAALIRSYGLGETFSKSLLIISDDLDLPLGIIRYRIKGSAGGHNGLDSIIAYLKTNEFPRLKIGIKPHGLTRQPGKAEQFVLKRFNKKELEQMDEDIIPRAVETIIERIRNNEQ